MPWGKKKIPCYVLIFDQFEIIKPTLDFLSRFADKLDIIVIENHSANTPKIKAYVQDLGKRKLIKRYYLFHENITNNAMNHILDLEIDLIKAAPFVMMTDGDLISEDDNWLDEEISILKHHKEVYACGISLSSDNLPLATFPDADKWVPPDIAEHEDYYECITGTHLQLMRGKGLADYLQWRTDSHVHAVDSAMHWYCHEVAGMKWARTKKADARHLTWDLYQDLNHPYTKHKLGLTFDETWHHERMSDFDLMNY